MTTAELKGAVFGAEQTVPRAIWKLYDETSFNACEHSFMSAQPSSPLRVNAGSAYIQARPLTKSARPKPALAVEADTRYPVQGTRLGVGVPANERFALLGRHLGKEAI